MYQRRRVVVEEYLGPLAAQQFILYRSNLEAVLSARASRRELVVAAWMYFDRSMEQHPLRIRNIFPWVSQRIAGLTDEVHREVVDANDFEQSLLVPVKPS